MAATTRQYADTDDFIADHAPEPRTGSRWEARDVVPEPRTDDRAYDDDVGRSRFPFSIVWTPLPPLTWLFPFIGHMGITDSRGVCYDFAGKRDSNHFSMALTLSCL
jgi:hypothetical protein